jgi:hypothetical protein
MRTLIISLIALLPACSYAQESESKYFYTRQECKPLPELMFGLKNKWQEQPLFSGNSLTFSVDGTPFSGGSLFFVNQDTGSWTLATLYADGYACVSAVGTAFEPYVD